MTSSSWKRKGEGFLRNAVILTILLAANLTLQEVWTPVSASSGDARESPVSQMSYDTSPPQPKTPLNQSKPAIDSLESEDDLRRSGPSTAPSPRSPSQFYAVQATLRAYSTEDPIDEKHRANRSRADRYLTATQTDANAGPGFAGPRSLLGANVLLLQFHDGHGVPDVALSILANPVVVDDTGGLLRRRVEDTGELHLEIRLPTHEDALAFGVRKAIVLLDKPWPVIESGSTAGNGVTESKE